MRESRKRPKAWPGKSRQRSSAGSWAHRWAGVRASSRIGLDLVRALVSPVERWQELAEEDRAEGLAQYRTASVADDGELALGTPGGELAVVSWNLHRGYQRGPLAASLEQILEEHQPDLLLFQEVPVYESVAFWDLDELSEVLADWHLFFAPMHRVRRRTPYYDFELSGQVMASRRPWKETRVVELPTVCHPKLGNDHCIQRIALRGAWEVLEGRRLGVYNLHLENTTGPRGRQVEHLLDTLERGLPEDEMVLLGGDFNPLFGRRETLFKALQEAGFRRLTQRKGPGLLPQLDHFFLRGGGESSARRLELPGSDHLPVLARLALDGPSTEGSRRS